MSWRRRFLSKLQNKTERQELLSYVFFGVATTAVNLAVYHLMLLIVDYRIANVSAIVCSKLFAYVTNKLFVFHSHCESMGELLLELMRFILARGATGLLDFFGLMIAVEFFGFDKIVSKYVIQVLVIVCNYLLGKKVVFNR